LPLSRISLVLNLGYARRHAEEVHRHGAEAYVNRAAVVKEANKAL
jgi:hypothetical protein